MISGGEAEINGTQYETLEKALAAAKANDTIKLTESITTNTAVTVSTAITIDLNDHSWTINGGLTVNAAVTVTDSGSDGKVYMNATIAAYNTLTLKNLDLYAESGFSVYNGKVEMKAVYSTGSYNFFSGMGTGSIVVYSGGYKFNPEKYIVPGTVVVKNETLGRYEVNVGSTMYHASVNGKNYETLQAAFDAAQSGDTVYVLMQTGDNALEDAALNGSKNIVLNLNNEEITAGSITVNPGSTLTIMNGWIDQTVTNYGTLTVSGNAKVRNAQSKGRSRLYQRQGRYPQH